MFKQQEKIILASQSESRKNVLNFANIEYELPQKLHSDKDEEIFKQSVNHLNMEDYVQKISNYKALIVSKIQPDFYILAGDQACVMDGEEVRKPYSLTEAIVQLTSFSGKTFKLVTSITLCKNGEVVWEYQTTPEVSLRQFSMRDAEAYAKKEEASGNSLVGVGGACRIESPYGIHMIKQVTGDQYSIMGLPLNPLINKLYEHEIFI